MKNTHESWSFRTRHWGRKLEILGNITFVVLAIVATAMFGITAYQAYWGGGL